MNLRFCSGLGRGVGLLLFCAFACISRVANGQSLIVPVHVTASSWWSPEQQYGDLISNTGLDVTPSSVSAYSQTPDPYANGMWFAGTGMGTQGNPPTVNTTYILFDLGTSYNLSVADIWQLAQTNLVGRGVESFALYGTTYGANLQEYTDPTEPYAPTVANGWEPILATSQLSEATSGSPVTAQSFNLTNATGVRQVYLQINSDYNQTATDYVGLSKVFFQGTAASSYDLDWNGSTLSGYWAPYFTSTTSGTSDAISPKAAFTIDRLNVTAGTLTLNPTSSLPISTQDLNVSGGATVNVNDFYSGDLIESNGARFQTADITTAYSMSVTGAGSNLNILSPTPTLGNTYVDMGSELVNTTLAISAGGVTTISPTTYFGDRTAAGNVTVDGVGSELVITSTGESAFGYGNADSSVTGDTIGVGTLAITNGGSASFAGQLDIGGYGGRGQIYVGKTDGTDTAVSTFSAASVSLATAGNTAGALLVVNPMGSAQISGDLGNFGGTITVNGGSITSNTLSDDVGDVELNANGSINAISAVYVAGGTFNINSGVVNAPFLGVTVGGALTINNGGSTAINGTLSISSGTATVNAGGVMGASAVTVAGGTLDLNQGWGVNDGGNTSVTSGGVNVVGGTLNVTGLATNASSSVSGNGSIVSAGVFNVLGSSFTINSGSAVSSTATTVTGGTLDLNQGWTLNDGGNTSVTSGGINVVGGTLNVTGLATNATSSVSGNAAVVSAAGFKISGGTFTVGAGSVSGTTGTVSAGSLVINSSGTVSLTGTTAISGAGTVTVNTGGLLNLNSAALTVNSTNSTTNKFTVAGGTAEIGSLATTGTNSANSAKAFSWTSGTLAFTGPVTSLSSYGTSAQNYTFTVPVGGLLLGSTTFSTNNVTVDGSIEPGLSTAPIGSFLTKNLDIANGATYDADIDLGQSLSDLLNVTGTVTLGGTSILDLNITDAPQASFAPTTYIIVMNDSTDAVSGTFGTIDASLPPEYQYSINYGYTGPAVNGPGTGNDIAVTVSPIPEPTGTCLLTLAAVASLWVRRRGKGSDDMSHPSSG